MNRYMSGSVVEVKAQFVNAAGAPANPDAAVLKYRKDAGTTTTITPVSDTGGAYHFNLDTTGWAGPDDQVWTYQFSGTGAVQAIGSKTFGVYPPSL